MKESPSKVLLIEALWTRPFIAYLARNELPEDRKEARQIIRRSRSFTLINGELYKRSILGGHKWHVLDFRS